MQNKKPKHLTFITHISQLVSAEMVSHIKYIKYFLLVQDKFSTLIVFIYKIIYS